MFTCLAKLLERLKFKKVRHLERGEIHIRVSIETIYTFVIKCLIFKIIIIIGKNFYYATNSKTNVHI